ncbi:MAG: NAD(P)H-quinone oxidoreductase subunit 3 [Candidatus Omnitrophota bacterium]|jgi:NAD(P)H-quinone oxidoreductase subunit 3
MSSLVDYIYVFIFLLIGIGFVVVNSLIPLLISPKSTGAMAREPYESGSVPIGSAWIRFDIYYYIFALIFLVFDVEAAFLFPVLLVYKSVPGYLPFIEVTAFLGILSFALLYAWRKGFFEWK